MTSRFDPGHRRARRLASALLLTLVVAAAAPALSAAISGATQSRALSGLVSHVADGDTLTVQVGRGTVTIRLEGIDAPEAGQAFGAHARTFLRVLAFSQQATVRVKETDRYGRLVARVVVAGKDLSEEMVRAGLAWHYLEYSTDPRLAALEKEARAKRVGLWADRSPVPPWVARRPGASRTPPQVVAGRAAPKAQAPSNRQGPFHGNVRSHVYHAPDCGDYNCPNCRALFTTRADAEAAGYRAHAACVNK